MDKFEPIYCNEQCPLGKKCCFGEIFIECIGNEPIKERHKCKFSKSTKMDYVLTFTTKQQNI